MPWHRDCRPASMPERRSGFHTPVIDAVRWLAALVVVISHAGLQPLQVLLGDSHLAEKALLALGSPFCGIAAVMMFFVVSGFCIHLPFTMGRTLSVWKFYLARFTRIGLPLLAASLIFQAAGLFPELNLILWSIYCEIIYYLVYPLILFGIRRWGLVRIFMTSVVLWIAVLIYMNWKMNGIYGPFTAWGLIPTAILGLPVWLGGCVVSESVTSGRDLLHVGWEKWYPLWCWRFGMVGIISFFNIVHFHSPLNYKLTMPMVGMFCAPWLSLEIRQSRPADWMARSGMACYSIYLMHQLGVKWIETVIVSMPSLLRWNCGLFAAAVISIVFYFFIERPSHQLARRFGRL